MAINQVQPTKSQQQGSGFVNLSKYLNANQPTDVQKAVGQGAGMEAANIRSQTGQNRMAFEQGLNTAKTALEQDKIASEYAIRKLQEGSNVDQNILNQASKIIGQGPEQYKAADFNQGNIGNRLSNLQNVAQNVDVGLQKFVGGKNYTQGQRSFDKLLYGSAPVQKVLNPNIQYQDAAENLKRTVGEAQAGKILLQQNAYNTAQNILKQGQQAGSAIGQELQSKAQQLSQQNQNLANQLKSTVGQTNIDQLFKEGKIGNDSYINLKRDEIKTNLSNYLNKGLINQDQYNKALTDVNKAVYSPSLSLADAAKNYQFTEDQKAQAAFFANDMRVDEPTRQALSQIANQNPANLQQVSKFKDINALTDYISNFNKNIQFNAPEAVSASNLYSPEYQARINALSKITGKQLQGQLGLTPEQFGKQQAVTANIGSREQLVNDLLSKQTAAANTEYQNLFKNLLDQYAYTTPVRVSGSEITPTQGGLSSDAVTGDTSSSLLFKDLTSGETYNAPQYATAPSTDLNQLQNLDWLQGFDLSNFSPSFSF